MAYTTSRVWYGLESYQWATVYTPSGAAPSTGWPVIVYRPGGGWKGADTNDLDSRVWWSYGLNYAGPHQEDYMVIVINTASVGYNRSRAYGINHWDLGLPKGYFVGTKVEYGGNIYRCIQHYDEDGTVAEPGVTAGWESYWEDLGATTEIWVDGAAYVLGDIRGLGVRLFQCIRPHTAAAGNDEPGTADPNWEDYWREMPINETGLQQVPGVGEMTVGGLDEMVRNCQEAVCWVRRQGIQRGSAAGDTRYLHVDPTRIALAGASAGGQMAGCAAYGEPLAWSRNSVAAGATRNVPYISSTPNALILSITPVDLTLHTEYSLLNGLYGEDATSAQWQQREAAIKRAMSPLHVMRRTGISMPTYLEYAGYGPHSTTYANLTGAAYHTADNGWLMLHALADESAGSMGRTDCRFLTNGTPAVFSPVPTTAASDYRVWSEATGSGVATGDDYDDLANDILLWLDTYMP